MKVRRWNMIFDILAEARTAVKTDFQKWEFTDVITDDKLPTKRLIWAVTDGEYHVVHYESGGYAHSFHVLVAKLKAGDSKPSFVWHAAGRQLKDFRAFL